MTVAYKVVTNDLKSPFVRNENQITYVVGDTSEAALGDEKGIHVVPTLDDAVHLRRWFVLRGARFLQVTYDEDDVLETVRFGGRAGGLSVAAITVVSEVTP